MDAEIGLGGCAPAVVLEVVAGVEARSEVEEEEDAGAGVDKDGAEVCVAACPVE